MDLSAFALGLFGLGAGEVLLVLFLVVLLFGVDKVPDIARSLGRAQARWTAAKDEVVETLELERAGLTREQVEFERAREAQVRGSDVPPETGDNEDGAASPPR